MPQHVPDPQKIRAKRRFGQNFLVDENVVRRIVEAASHEGVHGVVEIGPGRGALTRRLLDAGFCVAAIEIDRDMQAFLAEEFADAPQFRLIAADILNTSLHDAFDGPFMVVGNLPYNISTAILERLARERELFASAVLMFQREVAARVLADVNTGERGYLSVISQAAFAIEKLFDVGPNAFRPQPKVWSTVLKLVPRPPNVFDAPQMRALVARGFSGRRKMLRNTLKGVTVGTEKVDLSRRAESLSLEEWEFLSPETGF
ncbi:MAG: 16S rRNA (adenine(1518)-N(6)/adenine(1519)-N(6))-dimethyltransferase RsmA [Acidobacteria bacterium]|nr:16S rRNA (adenine(1518)-N(6)/adenine(1519)-N(6))-dimethyltransferase RsmA [Acidobacteriota bacterium]